MFVVVTAEEGSMNTFHYLNWKDYSKVEPMPTSDAPMPASKVRVVTSEYEFERGRLPRGRGVWWFRMGTMLVAVRGERLFSEARNLARQEAARLGFPVLSVMP